MAHSREPSYTELEPDVTEFSEHDDVVVISGLSTPINHVDGCRTPTAIVSATSGRTAATLAEPEPLAQLHVNLSFEFEDELTSLPAVANGIERHLPEKGASLRLLQ